MRFPCLAPAVFLLATACVPGRRATLIPGSDMALPRVPAVTVAQKNGQTCGSANLGGVGVVIGDAIKCSLLAPDSTRRPPAKPAGMP